DETMNRGALLLTGPYAFAALAAAGLEGAARLPRGRHATFKRAGSGVTVGRWDPLGGFVILSAVVQALSVFDSLMRGGSLFGLTLAGQDALETLLLEAGVPLPGIDFTPSRGNTSAEPSLQSLSPLAAESANEKPESRVLAGIEIESDQPAGFV